MKKGLHCVVTGNLEEIVVTGSPEQIAALIQILTAASAYRRDATNAERQRRYRKRRKHHVKHTRKRVNGNGTIVVTTTEGGPSENGQRRHIKETWMTMHGPPKPKEPTSEEQATRP